MSKKTRYKDNSKRQQPVQQQRAQAAMRQAGTGKQAKAADRAESQAEQGSGKQAK